MAKQDHLKTRRRRLVPVIVAALLAPFAGAAPAGADNLPASESIQPPPPASATAVTDAHRAMSRQARALGIELASVSVPVPTHASLEDAVGALLARHDALTVEAQQQLAPLALIPEPHQQALTRVVDAYLSFDDAVGRRQALVRQRGIESSAGLGDVLASRLVLFDAATDLAELNPVPSTSQSAAPFEFEPWLALSIGAGNDTYTDDFALVIDKGGNDTYSNNAGGSNLHSGEICALGAVVPSPAAALIDLGGGDFYTSGRSCGANGGGAASGAGFLYDAGPGDDTYLAGDFGTNGGGNFGGVGFLFDEDGSNTYTAGDFGTNGGGALGVGLLVDGAGGDTYVAGDAGTNGGGELGAGGLVDRGAGTDSYQAGGVGTNGGANGGTAFLIDAGGDDTYLAGSIGVNGGGSAGVGLLLDAGGFDSYTDDDGGSGTNKTVAPKGAVGAQIDAPG